jgi:hypothetical protein
MVNHRKPRKAAFLAIAVCLGILALALFSCKNPAGTDNDQQPYITVQNDCGIDLDIYMDGVFQFYLDNGEYYAIQNVAPGTHLLEAKKKGTDILVKSYTAETSANFSYTWTISSNAQLEITNNYGETLDIYGDGEFQSEVADQSKLLFATIPYREHLIEAKKQGGTTVVASTTIDVIEDVLYTWIIQK